MKYNFSTLFGSTHIEISESAWIIDYPYWTDEYFKKINLYKDISTNYDYKTFPKEETESKEEILRQIEELLKKL